MTKDEALKLALSALNEVRQETFRLMKDSQTLYSEKKVWEAIYTIKKVLAQPEQEPVAWEQFYPDIGKPQIAFNAEVIGYVAPQPKKQEPVAYDKTEMNCFVQDLYDKKMQEGKHGHYETMFHVVHQAIKKVPPQRTWVGLTDEEKHEIRYSHMTSAEFIDFIEAKLKDKNT